MRELIERIEANESTKYPRPPGAEDSYIATIVVEFDSKYQTNHGPAYARKKLEKFLKNDTKLVARYWVKDVTPGLLGGRSQMPRKWETQGS